LKKSNNKERSVNGNEIFTGIKPYLHIGTLRFEYGLTADIKEVHLEFIDIETRKLFSSIGIVRCKSFNPEGRIRRLSTDSVAIGNL
jgi:hypothetical protein